jgi:hypothetical protein
MHEMLGKNADFCRSPLQTCSGQGSHSLHAVLKLRFLEQLYLSPSLDRHGALLSPARAYTTFTSPQPLCLQDLLSGEIWVRARLEKRPGAPSPRVHELSTELVVPNSGMGCLK